MESTLIRSSFLRFFEERDHVVRPSASLIPVDPTLLLTNAGMVPFKPYFLGEEPPPFPRAVSVQKSFRTVDIDIIGTTARHFTFFEMLGNFSFGDYFKEKAIPYAYELVTEVFDIDPELLWFTVYETDDEAAEIWIDGVGVPPHRVQRRGKDNFWQMGVPGPAGPCSEIFFDRGPRYGADGGPAVDEERFIEIWNLVFMQNVQDRPYHVIGDLPAKSIDTGMGLERVAMVLQGTETVFDIDTVRPVLAVAERHAGVEYGQDPLTDVSLRVLADHGRSMTVLIADGVVPSNEGRGYVLRRVLRRAVRHAWRLGGKGAVTPDLVEATIDVLGDSYPELLEKKSFIQDVVSREEERFRHTLASGHNLLDQALTSLQRGDNLSGSVAFKLHDTYGFPVELTTEIAGEQGVEVDLEAFESEMAEQRARARSAWRGGEEAADAGSYRRLLDRVGPSEFLGYHDLIAPASVVGIVRDGESLEVAAKGETVEVFLDRTPFYAESGGQVGDKGLLESEGFRGVVFDTQQAVPGLTSHHVKVTKGRLQVGQRIEAMVDSARREAISKSHTGTHILHWSLREVLGEHVHQAGSLNEAGRLRFDFSHYGALSQEEFSEVERLANERVIANPAVRAFTTSMDEARGLGALAFFGDKYGDVVRVVEIGDFSKELCGGTHTQSAGQIGPLIILGESSIGSNLRRVEAYSGDNAYEYLAGLRRRLGETGQILRSKPEDVPLRVRQLLDRTRHLEEELSALRSKLEAEEAQVLVADATEIGGVKVVVTAREETPPGQLRALALEIRDRLGSGVVVVGSSYGGKGALVGVVSRDLVARGVSASELILAGARKLGGGGSRDPELAQAGGPRGGELSAALDAVREAAGVALTGL
ncbi:MAG: alanine--tRNA ligase [Gammaproteobacteria bacterium]|nr:alanine--tRNA ligase [Gammaproteobacteria bacterium]